MSGKNVLQALTAEMLGDIGKLHDEVKQLANSLPAAASTIRQAGQDSANSIQAAINKTVERLSTDLAALEVAKLQASLITNLKNNLDEIYQQTNRTTLFSKKLRTITCFCLISILSIATGFYCAKNHHNQEEMKQIAAGKDFLTILPLLDPLTKNKIINLIKEENLKK